jgi:hypothetical protein
MKTCGHTHELSKGSGTGTDGVQYCYACCGRRDLESMKRTGRICLYLVESDKSTRRARITNWPGSIEFFGRFRLGRHNIAGTRRDVWFSVDGDQWHGIQYGEHSQLLHCKKLKEAA